MKFAVVNLGCKVNKAELDTIAANLLAQENELVDLKLAEQIIINTCTVTGDAEKKTRKAVRRALRENPTASVLVTGCAAAIDPDFYQGLSPRVQIVSKASFGIPMREEAALHSPAQSELNAKVPLVRESNAAIRVGEAFPHRVSVKVQDGCNHSCTYCIVHIARGKAWSRPLDIVLAEVRTLEAAGVQEIMLSGIDLGSYHHDRAGLAQLLRALLENTNTMRFRISSIEPCSLNDETIALIASAKGRICRHLHLPLQSGSTKVLQEMNRPYTREYFTTLTEKLYAAIPELSLSTDIIVGFPGESEAEFQESLEVAKLARFSKIHAFRYSQRKGTPAAARADQIDAAVKDVRLQQLIELADELRFSEGQKRIGTTEEVLIETPGVATSESYYRVEVDRALAPGLLVARTLTAIDSSCIMKS